LCITPSQLQRQHKYYKMPHNVFLTGVTGFVGRYLLYQLCDAEWIDEVYLLVRAKKNVSKEDRYKEIMQDPLILESKKTGTKYDKVHLIEGDLMKPRLGMSESDLDLLSKKLTLVIHNAAVLNFAATIQNAIASNTTPTWELYTMCCERFEHKPAFVFVSTIATNSHLDPIPEHVTKLSTKAEHIYNYVRTIPKDRCLEVEEFLKEGRLDAYGFSKGLVEAMISEHIEETGGVVPVNFLRPGGIIGAWNGPLRGWIHNTCFYGTLIYQIHEGKLPFFLADGDKEVNMAPVDYVGNLCMASCLECLDKRDKNIITATVTNGSKIRIRGLSINFMEKFGQDNYAKYKNQMLTKNPWIGEPKRAKPYAPWLLNQVWIFKLLFNVLVFFPLYLYSFYDSTSYRFTKVRSLTKYLYKFAQVLHPYLSAKLDIENGHLDDLQKRYGDRYPMDACDVDREEFLDAFYLGLVTWIMPYEKRKEKAQWEKFNKNSKLKEKKI